jgi:DNA polymerase I-like protein with 3'-5' exonuclease and polymerase domains
VQELLPPLWRTEMPLVRVVADMEAAGLAVNESILDTGECGLEAAGCRLQLSRSCLPDA